MNWVESELSAPPDPRDAWLRLEPARQCEHRFRLQTVPAVQADFYRLGFRTFCTKCKAEA